MTTPPLPPRTLPSVADVARIVFGLAIVLVVFFVRATPPAGRTSILYVFATIFIVLLCVVVLGVPGYLFRGRRGDWRGFARFCGNGLLIVGGVSLAGLAVRSPARRPAPLVESLRAGSITIDAFLRAERAAAPRAFDVRFAGQRERELRSAGLVRRRSS